MINNIDDGTGTLDFQVKNPTGVEVLGMINNINDGTGKLDFQGSKGIRHWPIN